jgi:hypothetical protein
MRKTTDVGTRILRYLKKRKTPATLAQILANLTGMRGFTPEECNWIDRPLRALRRKGLIRKTRWSRTVRAGWVLARAKS